MPAQVTWAYQSRATSHVSGDQEIKQALPDNCPLPFPAKGTRFTLDILLNRDHFVLALSVTFLLRRRQRHPCSHSFLAGKRAASDGS